MRSAPNAWVTILAGGTGSRFWPLSTPERPKQLLPLAGPEPLLVDTINRLREFVPLERVRVLTREEMVAPLQAVAGLDEAAFLTEPPGGGTASALVRAAWEIARADPEAVHVSLHADAAVRPAAAFRDVLAAGTALASQERLLVTVAALPDRPETGYGYIEPGDPLPAPDGHRAYRVRSFVEKPSPKTAARYVEMGYRWNTGIFVWPVATFLREAAARAPEIARALPHLERGDAASFFRDAGTVSVDVAVLERSPRVASIDATFEWEDVGSWEALARTRRADSSGNVSHGDVQLAEAGNNIAYAESGRIVLLGVSDLLVARTGDVTLVMPRLESPNLKRYLNLIDATTGSD